MVDLAYDDRGWIRAWLLDRVPGWAGAAYAGWLAQLSETFRGGITVATLPGVEQAGPASAPGKFTRLAGGWSLVRRSGQCPGVAPTARPPRQSAASGGCLAA